MGEKIKRTLEEWRERNADLAALAKDGDKQALYDLWSENKGLIYKFCFTWYRRCKHVAQNAGVEVNDLTQCGYIAVCNAVKVYDPEKSTFYNSLVFALKKEIFRAVTGNTIHCELQENGQYLQRSGNMLNYCDSLDEPLLSGDEEQDSTLIDFVADPSAFASFQNVDERDYNEQLHYVLDYAMQGLTEKEEAYIRHKYYNGGTCKDYAADHGVSTSMGAIYERNALRKMRRNSQVRHIHDEILADGATNGCGWYSWKARRASVQEATVERMEYKGVLYPTDEVQA